MKRFCFFLLALTLAAALCPAALAENDVFEVNYRLEETDELVPVTLLVPGSVRSRATLPDGTEQLVPTSRMTWDTNAEEDSRVAFIYAPNSGRATMRLSEKPKSSVVRKLYSGSIAFVTDYGREYTGIYCEGKHGYVQTSILRFLPRERDYASAVTSYKGKTTGRTKLNLRISPKGSARILSGVYPGMTAEVFQNEYDFLLVDCNGWHGYIRKGYITLDEGEEVPVPTPEPTATPVPGDPA